MKNSVFVYIDGRVVRDDVPGHYRIGDRYHRREPYDRVDVLNPPDPMSLPSAEEAATFILRDVLVDQKNARALRVFLEVSR